MAPMADGLGGDDLGSQPAPPAVVVPGAGGLVQPAVEAAPALLASAAAMGCEGPCGTRPIATDAGSLKTHHRVAVLVLGLINPARLSPGRRRDLDLAKLPR
jgi:hypothetical protein